MFYKKYVLKFKYTLHFLKINIYIHYPSKKLYMVVSLYIFTEFFKTTVTVKTFYVNILCIVGSVSRRNLL
jgi:hypothetical protein